MSDFIKEKNKINMQIGMCGIEGMENGLFVNKTLLENTNNIYYKDLRQ